MFNKNLMTGVAKFLDVQEDEAKKIIIEQAKYLRVNPTYFLKSFKVMYRIKKESEEKKAEMIKYESKNILILKYADEIIKLYTINGYGYLKISNYLNITHNVKVSKSAIENFIKKNKLIKA